MLNFRADVRFHIYNLRIFNRKSKIVNRKFCSTPDFMNRL